MKIKRCKCSNEWIPFYVVMYFKVCKQFGCRMINNNLKKQIPMEETNCHEIVQEEQQKLQTTRSAMEKLKHEIKMLITIKLLGWLMRVVPKNKSGDELIVAMYNYLKTAP